MYPTTPDGRYFVVKGKLWRCTNPSLNEVDRQRAVNELMAARRAVKAAKAFGDTEQLKLARACVQTAKVALGERLTISRVIKLRQNVLDDEVTAVINRIGIRQLNVKLFA